jgi:lysophospholipid acyltransferase (LPLAT)-like uncharacterized protein
MAEAVPKTSRIIIPHKPKWFQILAANLVVAMEHGLTSTLRFRLEDRSGWTTSPKPEPVIFCVWHNRLALALYAYRKVMRKIQPDRQLAALVSASKDGAFLAAILEKFQVQPVRGSSSRRGAQALLELTSWAERGYDLAITPDGPRGPCYTVQDGVMAVAQLTGLPIAPVSYHLSGKHRLKSWDRFQVPLPFARCDMMVGELVRVPREASDEERNALKLTLENRMREITKD